jgi:hypothetical protein
MNAPGGVSAADPLGRFGWNLVARDVALSECWDDALPQLEWCASSWARTRSDGSPTKEPAPWVRRSPGAR